MVNIKSPSSSKKSRKVRKNSKILKKYEIAYENCIKKAMKSHKNKKECLKKSKNIKKSTDKKRSPTKYQKFVKKHSNDAGISGLSPASRMRKIAKLWKKKNINKN